MQNQYLGSSSQAPSLPDYGIGSLASTSGGGVGIVHTSSHLATTTQSNCNTASANQPAREELKTQFVTREGLYRVMTLAEYSRPNRVPFNQQTLTQGGNTGCSAPVRVSFLTVPSPPSSSSIHSPSLINGCINSGLIDDDPLKDAEKIPDRICFNVGREIYVYLYKGTSAAADLSRPIDKRVYKGTYPTCHHFNQETATSTTCSLLIGFSAGQMQLIDPFQKEYQMSRLYNEERLIEKTPVTCIRWVPGHPQHFLVSHTSGCMYLYHEDIPCSSTTPSYQLFKQGDKFSVYTCKTKSSRNPIYKWTIGQSGAIHQFVFSPTDPNLLATVGHDGYLRIFNYHSMELLSFMKSYFGGLLCLSWSPDGALIATGGEDDLLTVYSFSERRVVCRGIGHKSWISQVAFDPYSCILDDTSTCYNTSTIDDEVKGRRGVTVASSCSTSTSRLSSVSGQGTLTGIGTPNGSINVVNGPSLGVSYRLGSVGHDTQLCLWDVTDDILKQPLNSQRHRNSTLIAPLGELQINSDGVTSSISPGSMAGNNINANSSKDSKRKKLQKRGLAALAAVKLGGGNNERRSRDGAPSSTSNNDDIDSNGILTNGSNGIHDDTKLLGTRYCPRMSDLPVMEPLICKKIAHERLTVLEFRKDCFVTACQEGFICTWARPGKGGSSLVRRDCGGDRISPNDSSSTMIVPPSSIPYTTHSSNTTSSSYHHHLHNNQQTQSNYWLSH